MHHVVSATTNPAKIQAILQAFDEIFGEGSCHIESVSVESGVPEQPFGSEETRAGARNRVANARIAQPHADFWVAIEAGIDDGAPLAGWSSKAQIGAEKRAPPPCRCLRSFLSRLALAKPSGRSCRSIPASIRLVVKRERLGFSPPAN